jgi:hypothetical protein
VSDYIPTLADVCCAIAEGQLAVSLEGPVYRVSAHELRRYFNEVRPLPSISSTPAQKRSPRPEFLDWSADIQKHAALWSSGPFFSGSEQGGCVPGQ